MKIAQLFILILAFLIIKPADAGVLLEPVLGYSFGKSETDLPGTNEDKFKGSSYGARVGYQNLGLQLGIDYLRSSVELDDNDFKENLSVNEFAGFVGFEFPVLIRVYAGYIFSANGETEADYGAGNGKEKVKFTDGTGMKAGIGFTGLPFVDINFEYRKGTFTEFKDRTNGKQSVDTDYNAFMIGVSLPFVL